MIDLHTHTSASDGTTSPGGLISEAVRAGIQVIAITDHDTFAGYDAAIHPAREAGIELICGIELSTKLNGQSVHLLGYFFLLDRIDTLRQWVLDMQASRHDRNARLVKRLQQLGIDITLEEVLAIGRGLPGRPHFAQIMLKKGYVTTLQQAFDEYLDESARGYVQRSEPLLVEGLQKIHEAGGITSLAHPFRPQSDLPRILPTLRDAGLDAIEVWHSDHSTQQIVLYRELAQRHGLLMTGGSDYHGEAKPGIKLGTGRNGNVAFPPEALQRLRQSEARLRANCASVAHPREGYVRDHVAYRDQPTGTQLQQSFAQHPDLRSCARGTSSPQTQLLHQHASGGGQQHPELVGPETAATGAVDL